MNDDLSLSRDREALSRDREASSLSSWREEFPILETCVYLASHSQGAMPRGVAAQLAEYARAWGERGTRAWEESWWDLPGVVGDKIAALVNAEKGSISVHPNATLAQASIISCFNFWSHRNKVVYSELEFPSMMYLYEGLIARGARIVRVPSRDGVNAGLEDLLAAIDGDTMLVPLSHVLFRNASIQDVRAVTEKARRVGAKVVLDCYQSAGTVPLDVRALGVDFAVGGTLKWLCGGPGVAFLYCAPETRRRVSPQTTGWVAHKNPFAFELPPILQRDDAGKFATGTPDIAPLYACQPGLDIVRQAGIAAIRAKSQRQTQRLVDAALSRGWKLNSPTAPAHRGGAVALEVPGADTRAIAKELGRRNIVVDFRPGAGIRISPHFYSNDDECDAAIAEIERIASGASAVATEPAAAAPPLAPSPGKSADLVDPVKTAMEPGL